MIPTDEKFKKMFKYNGNFCTHIRNWEYAILYTAKEVIMRDVLIV